MTLPFKQFFTFFLLLLLPLLAEAQRRNAQDVVYLLNGGIMRGRILEITDTNKVVLETEEKNVFVFERIEVQQIAREPKPIQVAFKENGFINYTEIGVMSGRSSPANSAMPGFYHNSITLQTFNGHQFSPAFQLGVTTGIEWHASIALLPISLGVKGDLWRRKVSPYYSFDVGYGFNWLNENNTNQRVNGGMMWHPGVGIKVLSSKGTAWVISLGYKSQRASTWVNWGWQRVEEQIHYKRLAIRMGLSF